MDFSRVKEIKTISSEFSGQFDEVLNGYLDSGWEIIRLYDINESSTNKHKYVAQVALFYSKRNEI